MNREQIYNAVDSTWEKVRTTWASFNYVCKPTVTFVTKGKVAGRAFYSRHMVEFNSVLARENSEDFMDTIIHEVAHLVTHRLFPLAKQHHGPEFKRICQMLGGSGERCHNYDVSNVKRKINKTYHIWKCACQEHLLSPQKHKKGMNGTTRYSCRQCKTQVMPLMKTKIVVL